MKIETLFVLAIALTLLMGGTAPSPLQRPDIQRDLAALTKRGFTYRMLNNDMIEVTDPVNGEKRLKALREPDEAQIRSWAAQRDVPILEINPTTVDTTRHVGWYNYWTEVPLSNSEGIPLVVGDIDGNGKPEVYGAFYDYASQDYEARVYEIDSSGIAQLRYKYVPRPGVSILTADVDRNSLKEVLWIYGGGVYDYEQVARDSLPTHLRFIHERYQGNTSPGYTGIYVGILDPDSLTDLLYKGSEPDSMNPNEGIAKVYVAEYNADSTNFERMWSSDYGFHGNVSGIGGFAVDDFDGDGRREFVLCDLWSGQIFVTENVGDNTFAQTWRDSTPFANLYYVTSGDVDGDGRPEFFVGATTSSGNWTLVYEADSDNSYSLKFIFHLLAGGTFDSPTYLTTDVDGDGRPELVIFSGEYIHVFKAQGHNDYVLFYLKREVNRHSIQFYDFNGDGIKDHLVSKDEVDSLGGFRFKADVYTGTSLVHVDEERQPERSQLLQNFPNPFNPSTTIEFSLTSRLAVSLKIYDLSGKEVVVLLDRIVDAGAHSVRWDGAGRSSGVYFCCLRAGSTTLTRKLLLLH